MECSDLGKFKNGMFILGKIQEWNVQIFGLLNFKFVMFLVIQFWVVQSLCLSFLGSDGAVLRRAPGRGGLRTPSTRHCE